MTPHRPHSPCSPCSGSSGHRSRWAPLALAAVLALAACGGDSDSGDSSADDDSTSSAPATDAPPDTEAVAATDPPPVTDPPPATDPADESSDAFCEASRNVWVPIGGLDHVGSDGAAARASFDVVQELLPDAIEAAPDEAGAAPAIEMQTILAGIRPSLELIDFDLRRADELIGTDLFEEMLGNFFERGDELADFLQAGCGFSEEELDDAALAFGQGVSGQPGADTATPETIDVVDETQRIRLAVPAAWSDVDGTPNGDAASVVASADASGFLDSFTEPGVFIEVAPSDDAQNDVTQVHETTVTNYVDVGCTDLGSVDYDDGLYAGLESALDCAPGTTTIVITGTNAASDLVFNIGLVIEDGDAATRGVIVETFQVVNDPNPPTPAVGEEPTPEPAAPPADDGATPVDGEFVVLTAGPDDLQFLVPGAWTDVNGNVSDDGRRTEIAAATDLSNFGIDFTVPGIALTIVTDVADGDAAYRATSTEVTDSLEAEGCTLIDANVSFGDTLRSIDAVVTCIDGMTTHAFSAAVGPDLSTTVLAIIAVPADDTTTRDTIINSILGI